MINHASRGHLTRTWLFSLVAALVAAASVSAVASGKAAADTGSYTITSITAPNLFNEDEFTNGFTYSSAPAGVPATATITSISASFDWIPKPNPAGRYSSNTNYSVFLCQDSGDTNCANVSPTYSGQNSWTTINSSDFVGDNASTLSYHVVAGLFDSAGTGAPIKQAINPDRHADSQSITVNYTY